MERCVESGGKWRQREADSDGLKLADERRQQVSQGLPGQVIEVVGLQRGGENDRKETM